VSETQPNPIQGNLFSPLLLTWWVGGWVGAGWGGGFPKIECRLGRIEKLTATETKKIKLNIPTLMLGLESKTQAKGYFIFTSTLAPLTLIMLFCVKNVENFTPEKKKRFFWK